MINAMVDSRFEDAIKDANAVDKVVNELSEAELEQKYPLLGVPFTVKEPCGVEGKFFVCSHS